MASFQNLTFNQGETWPLQFSCVDELDQDLVPDAIGVRVASQTGVVVDLLSTDDTSGIVISGTNVAVTVAVALEDFAPSASDQYFTYAVRAFMRDGRVYDQQCGTIRVRPSPYGLFAFTAPDFTELAGGIDPNTDLSLDGLANH